MERWLYIIPPRRSMHRLYEVHCLRCSKLVTTSPNKAVASARLRAHARQHRRRR